MDLLLKVILAAILVAFVLVGLYMAIQKIVLNSPITKEQAITLILNDLQKYNATSVNITNATPSVYPGSWHIIASVVYNGTTPCPTYVIYSYDYPQYRLVDRTENLYTSYNSSTNNCRVLGFANMTKNYMIASAPVAIAWSYNLSNNRPIPSVRSFVNEYGYSNIIVSARFYGSSSVYNNTWIINYSAPRANRSVYVALAQIGGALVSNYTIPR